MIQRFYSQKGTFFRLERGGLTSSNLAPRRWVLSEIVPLLLQIRYSLPTCRPKLLCLTSDSPHTRFNRVRSSTVTCVEYFEVQYRPTCESSSRSCGLVYDLLPWQRPSCNCPD